MYVPIFTIYVVDVSVKSRVVTVKGPKGQLVREFKHVQLDMQLAEDGKSLKIDLWFGNRKCVASVRYKSKRSSCIEENITMMTVSINNPINRNPIESSYMNQQNYRQSYYQHDHRSDQGIQVQDEILLCAFPHQRCHKQRRRKGNC